MFSFVRCNCLSFGLPFRYKKEVEEAKKHEKLNHPGGKQQMEEVWEEEDGLDKEQFEPRTFFHLHG